MRKALLAALAALLLHACSWPTRVEKAWIRLPAAAGAPGVAYFEVEGGSGGGAVSGLRGPFARTELHRTVSHAGTMHMAPMQPVSLESGEKFSFHPGGPHIMLFGVDPRLKSGDRVSLTVMSGDDYEGATVEAIVVGPGEQTPYRTKFLGLF